MTNYTLRIELIGNPGYEIYNDLHARMKKGGFLQTINGVAAQGAQVTFALPHATYYGSLDATPVQVRDWASKHAAEAWGKSIVFVAATVTWAIG